MDGHGRQRPRLSAAPFHCKLAQVNQRVVVHLPALRPGVLRLDAVLIIVEQIIMDLYIRRPSVTIGSLAHVESLQEAAFNHIVANDDVVAALPLKSVWMTEIVTVKVAVLQQEIVTTDHSLNSVLAVVIDFAVSDGEIVRLVGADAEPIAA